MISNRDSTYIVLNGGGFNTYSANITYWKKGSTLTITRYRHCFRVLKLTKHD